MASSMNVRISGEVILSNVENRDSEEEKREAQRLATHFTPSLSGPNPLFI